MSHQRLINQKLLFDKAKGVPIIANNVSIVTEEQKEHFDNMLLSNYEDDTLKPAPQCDCGARKGLYYLGEHCEQCGTTVTETYSSEVESLIWLVPLKGTPAFMTPVCWKMFQHAMQFDKVDCLKFLTDPMYHPKRKLPDRLQLVLDSGHKRGLTYFYDNFDEIMRIFIDFTGKIKTPYKLQSLKQMIEYNRDRIFTEVLPVPNKVLFPVEKSNKSNFGDKSTVFIVDAIRTIQEGEERGDTLSLKQKENRMVRCMELFTEFHYNFDKKIIGGKNGAARQHIFGGRWHFTSRAVVVSLFEPHEFKGVHFPWAIAMEQFSVQVINKLIRRGHSLVEIFDLMKKHALVYSDYINEIFEELIDESPFMGLPIILQRNPTIRRGSAILVYVTHIKQNADDYTISISVGNLISMNADFDGDQLNNYHLQDVISHNNFVVLSPDYNVMDLSKPWKLSGNLKFHPPVISTAVNWISHGRRKAYGESNG